MCVKFFEKIHINEFLTASRLLYSMFFQIYLYYIFASKTSIYIMSRKFIPSSGFFEFLRTKKKIKKEEYSGILGHNHYHRER